MLCCVCRKTKREQGRQRARGREGLLEFSTGYLWFPRFSGVDGVEFLENALVPGLDGLLLVDVVHLRLPTAEHQDHGT